jgi:hypothetical protein
MSPRLSGLAIVLLLACGPAATVHADDDAEVGADPGDGFYVDSVEETEDATEGNSVDSPIGEFHQQPACENICTGEYTCPDGTFETHSWLEGADGELLWESYWCPSDGGVPGVTGGLVATAFRRIPLPPSTFSIQPPGGRTLVNFDTNFFTEERSLDRTVRLLGQRVDLRIEAHSYTWHFDDGESVTTSKPGAPYPKLQVTHNYLQTGGYRPALDITWVADYRVNGGAWQPVPGSVTIEGGPTNLRAIEARPTLVGYEG